MKTVRLEGISDVLIQAIRIMLENITESHRIIERYTQPAVLDFLTEGINPLTVPVHKTEQLVLFGDIVAFSYLSGLFPVEEVAELVNLFLEISSREVVAHGGQVTKYVGDCIVAHFPPDRADDAIRACLAILRQVHDLRVSAGHCRLQRFLYCGLGLSKGPVIEGNIGSSVKMDCSEDWGFEKVGEFQLKGQSHSLPIFSLDDPIVRHMKSHQAILQDIENGTCELP